MAAWWQLLGTPGVYGGIDDDDGGAHCRRHLRSSLADLPNRRRRSAPFAEMTRDEMEVADAGPDPDEVLAAQNRLERLKYRSGRVGRTRPIHSAGPVAPAEDAE